MHRQHRAAAEVVDASGAKPLMPAPTPQPLPPPSPDDDRSIDNPASGQTSKRARGGDVPPVMKRVIEERERQERELEAAKQLDRDRADAARRQSYVHPSMFPLTNRPIADPKHTKVLFLDLRDQLEIAEKCTAFIEIRNPPPLFYGHQDAFAHSAATVRSVVATLGPNANFKIGVTKHPAHRYLTYLDYGYFNKGYRRLIVVFAGRSTWCAELEARLIQEYKDVDGLCDNKNPGGENVPSDGVGRFVYIAVSPRGLGNDSRHRSVTDLRDQYVGDCIQYATAVADAMTP